MQTDRKGGVQRFGVSLDPELLFAFDGCYDHHHFVTRSEAICDLIR